MEMSLKINWGSHSPKYGTPENTEGLKKNLSKLILCVEMENWEKAEMFMETIKHSPVHELYQLLTDIQAQPCSPVLPGNRRIYL